MENNKIFETIKKEINDNDIVLFMKGSAEMPQCGFSQMSVQILQHFGAPFKDINILDSDDIRQGIKDFSDWPTVPQLYIKGEFVGGCDIMREMFEDGELKQLLQDNGIAIAA